MKYITKKLDFSNQTLEEMSLNSKKFYNLIKKRRSVRDFKIDLIDYKIIKNAILAAGTAPSGANLQPWHFVVIKNKSIKKKIRIAAEIEEKIRADAGLIDVEALTGQEAKLAEGQDEEPPIEEVAG